MGKKNKKLSSAVESRRKKGSAKIPLVKNNPFEVRLNRLKHNVIGKKIKTDKGVPGVARGKAVEKRKKTLLKEYKQRFKRNTIIDRRFGEFDDSITAEEKMLKRYTLEKQRHHEKAGLYNLEDDEEELTHYGQNLADIANFDDAGLKLTDDEEEDDVGDHFGGFLKKKKSDERTNDVAEKKLTKQEVMDEIVANSKKKKFERQQTQEQAFELTQKLDTEWKEIRSLLVKRDENNAGKKEKADDYDKTVNELIFEAKARASDRLKTDEEIARDEKQKLEELEKQRLLRMLGVTVDDENESQFASADAIVERKSKKNDDRYEVSYRDGKMVMAEGMEDFAEILKNGNEESDESDEEDEDESEEEDEESDHEDLFSDEDEDEERNKMEVEKEKKKKIPKEKKKKKMDSMEKDLSYVYEAPRNLKEFLRTVRELKEDDVYTVLTRIRKCHHIKLDVKNKQKMEILLDVLLDYIDSLCDGIKPPLKFINKLAEFILPLVGDVPTHSKKTFQTRLTMTFGTISSRFKLKDGCIFPVLKELVFFKIIGLIYPTSDLNHIITTPCLILMAMILSKGHIMNVKDIISGIFLLNIVLDHISLSKRYIPEVIPFLAKLLYQAASSKVPIKKTSTMLNLRKSEQNLLVITKKIAMNPTAINLSKCLSNSCNLTELDNDVTRISCIKNTLLICKKFSQLYKDLETFNEIFQPCVDLLKRMPIEKYPTHLKTLHEETLLLMKSKEIIGKVPLTLQARKPIPLPLLEPNFDEQYEVRSKRRAGDKARNEKEKLKYKIKKETKGAMREIRKDAHFLAKEQLKETQERDADRKRKVKNLQNAIENERREIREMEKASGKRF